jgi:hypothetical protein
MGAALLVAVSIGAVPVLGNEDGLQGVSGSITFHFLAHDAVRFSVKGDEDGDPSDDYATLKITPDSTVGTAGPDGVRASGTIALTGALILDHPAGQTALIDPVLRLLDGEWVLTHGSEGEHAFVVRHTRRSGDDALVGGYLVGSDALAGRAGLEMLSGRVVGAVLTDAVLSDEGEDSSAALGADSRADALRAPAGESTTINIGCSRLGLNASGNGDDFAYYGESGGIRAFSFASTACNYGTGLAEWISGHGGGIGRHPVIGQNMYRLQDGRFEQVGQSWLKHSFCAVSEPTCNTCTDDGGCNFLGLGCADTYWATLNDGASGGSKAIINPQGVQSAGGTHSTQGAAPSGPTAIRGRLQVKTVDQVTGLPATNGGVMYFGELQYVTHDEARQNRNNNCSWRQVYFPNASSIVGTAIGQPSVHAQEQALEAWKDNDAQVQLVHVYEVTGQPWGRYTVGYRVYDNGDGTWDYEYAVHNMNGDRGVGSFSVPVPNGVTVTDIGFHDVDYHSGDPYSGIDWTPVQQDGALTWSTTPFATNVNANAIRWGTLYNFRFTADTAPVAATLTLGLFKPGAPTEITALAAGPDVAQNCKTDAACADLDENGVRDDACVWWSCDAGACNGTDVDFANYGGKFGECTPDGIVDANDGFHALNCFSNQSTSGVPGETYPCEENAPLAANVDAASLGSPCTPDGVCDANDYFTALNVFEGVSPCSCAGPAPGYAPTTSARVSMTLSAAQASVRPGGVVSVAARIDQPLADLRGYQLHVETSGGHSGQLELVDMTIEPRKDVALADQWRAFNLESAQLAAGRSSAGVSTAAGAYLATFTFRATKDASGSFVIDLRRADAGGRSALFTTPVDQQLDISGTTPARVDVVTSGLRTRVSSSR